MLTASFGHPPAPARDPPRAAGGYLLQYGPPWATAGQPASPWSSSQAAGEPLHQEHLLPLLPLNWPWCLQSCFSHIFSLLSPAAECCYAGFFTFLNTLSYGYYYHCWWGRPWPAVDPSWSQPALAILDTGEDSSSFSQKPPLWTLHYQKLAMQTQYK